MKRVFGALIFPAYKLWSHSYSKNSKWDYQAASLEARLNRDELLHETRPLEKSENSRATNNSDENVTSPGDVFLTNIQRL